MKGKILNLTLLLLSFFILSCSDMISPLEGRSSVSFSLAAEPFRSAAREPVTKDASPYSIKVLLKGDYTASKTAAYNPDDGGYITVTFDGIPAGKKIYAEAEYYCNDELIAAGTSDRMTLAAGLNKLPLDLKHCLNTKYALYTRDGGFEYYLADSPATVPEAPSVSSIGSDSDSMTHSFCFDSRGNFYALSVEDDGTFINSNDSSFGTDGRLECRSATGAPMPFTAIACDLSNNSLYAFGTESDASDNDVYVLFGSGSLLSDGDNEQTAYVLTPPADSGAAYYFLEPDFFCIHEDTAYLVADAQTGGQDAYYLVKADLNKKAVTAEYEYGESNYTVQLETLCNLKTVLSGVMGDNFPLADYTDILCQDGAVYLLVNAQAVDFSEEWLSIGGVIKYDLSNGSAVTLGFSDASSVGDFADYNFYAFSDSSLSKVLYSYSYKPVTVKGSAFLKYDESRTEYKVSSVMPDSVCLPAFGEKQLSQKAFYGPKKFIAVKPKKLVVADDGFAFYTNDDDVLACKNVNRVVTVDLENFAFSIEETSKAFDFNFQESIGDAATLNEFYDMNGIYSASLYDSDFNQVEPASVYVGVPCSDDADGE